MSAKKIAVKKYVVRLSATERERLETVLRSGKHPVQTRVFLNLCDARSDNTADTGAGQINAGAAYLLHH